MRPTLPVAILLVITLTSPSLAAAAQPFQGGRRVAGDPCVDPEALRSDEPGSVIVVAEGCNVSVKVYRTNEGVTVEVIVETAEGSIVVVLKCADPGSRPLPGRPGTPERPYCTLLSGLA
jgi:hypothetical protein